MLTLLGFCLLLQVDADAVRRLSDADAAVRDKAQTTLKELPYTRSGELRELLKTEDDLERRERLRAVVRHLAGKEAEALYEDGKLQASLLKQAESEGATDPEAEVGRRLASAGDSLLKIWARDADPGCKKILFPEGQRVEVCGHGRYAIPPLIEGLSNSNGFSAAYMLIHWIPDAIPALCGHLRGEDGASSPGVCWVLGQAGGERGISLLRSIKNDPTRSETLREFAFYVLQSTWAYPESCYPDVIERLAREVAGDEENERVRATEALKEHPPSVAIQLREFAMELNDPAPRQRLEAIIGHLEAK